VSATLLSASTAVTAEDHLSSPDEGWAISRNPGPNVIMRASSLAFSEPVRLRFSLAHLPPRGWSHGLGADSDPRPFCSALRGIVQMAYITRYPRRPERG